MTLSDKQKGVLANMVVGIVVAVALLWYGMRVNPFDFAAAISVVERLQVAVIWSGLLALSLLLAIGRLARYRFFSAQDIDGGAAHQGTDTARELQAILQNTLEQVVLAFVTYLVWAALMPSQYLSVIPLAALSFFAGRLLFFAGYARGAKGRALGFALTFYPTAGMLIYSLADAVIS